MSNKRITFKISVTPAKNLCDYEESGEYVKKFKLTALNGDKPVGIMHGFIFSMFDLMRDGMLVVFDETILMSRLYSSIYNGEPLTVNEDDIYKGLNNKSLAAFNKHFNSNFVHVDQDDGAWADHYDIVLGYVDSLNIDPEFRGLGIGSKMMNMLSRFRNTVDFMVLQSFPEGVTEQISNMGLSSKERDSFSNSEEGKALYAQGGVQIDKFYSNLGYKNFKVNGCNWMAIDRNGLKAIRKKLNHSIEDQLSR